MKVKKDKKISILSGFFDIFKRSPRAQLPYSGTKSGYLFDGKKFSGSSMYPSAWNLDNEKIRENCRIAFFDSSQAQSIIFSLVDSVIGDGLTLESRPLWQMLSALGKNDQERHDFSRDIEIRFDLWAKSHESDSSEVKNFYELQYFEYLNRLRDGETFWILRYSNDKTRLSPLSLQQILPEQVRTPLDTATMDAVKALGHAIIDGIEVDGLGKKISIYVFENQHSQEYKKIPFFSPSGRRYVIHSVNSDTIGAIRGTSILASCLHELKKIVDYSVAELESAVMNAILAVWVKPSTERSSSTPFKGIQKRENEKNCASGDIDQATFDKPGLIVQNLKAGEELQSFDTKRPSVNFGTFVQYHTKVISASKGIPIEVLDKSFNANYSASRASLLLHWQKVEVERVKVESQFLDHIFEAWFDLEVSAGRIKAGLYGDSGLLRKAWTSHAWAGKRLPSIDPLKEATADDARLAQGSTTRERVSLEYNGSDAMENISRLAVENLALSVALDPLLDNKDKNLSNSTEEDEKNIDN
jgi:lambda family phage portal protein